MKISYCTGYLKSGKYCALAEVCYRCCDCEKSRNLRRYGERKSDFAQYDEKTNSCPYYLNRAQWVLIKSLSKL